MLQIALLLTCGLSQYMWSISTSVASVVISFTLLGFFYVGIVVAGTSSYKRPFQTPASVTVRHLENSKAAEEMVSLPSSPSSISQLISATRRNTWKFPLHFSLPGVNSLFCATWVDARRGLASVSDHVQEIVRQPFYLWVSLSYVASCIQDNARKLGHQTIAGKLMMDSSPVRRLRGCNLRSPT